MELQAAQSTDPPFASFPEFCGLLEIRLKSGGTKLFKYDDWHQEQQQFEAERTGRDIILKPRQVGITTLELARDLYYAITHPGTNVLIIAHEEELAEQLFLIVQIFAGCLRKLGKLPRTLYESKREIVFADSKSAVRIVAAGETQRAAEKKARSGTVHRLHATEMAFWGAAAETMGAALQSVPADGEVVEESTANGVGGLFYEDVQAAREKRTGYQLHFFPWWQHQEYRLEPGSEFDPQLRKNAEGKPDPWESRLRALGCDDAQLCWWRSKVDEPKIGLERALQDFPVNIDTCFRTSGQAWIDSNALDAIADRVCEPLRIAPIVYGGQRFEPARIYKMPVPGRVYVVFGDVAEGVAGDGSSAHVLEKVTGETVATWWSDTTEPGDFGTVLAVLGYMYNSAVIAPERNNHGHATLERLTSIIKYPNLFYHDDGRLGWNTTAASRPVLWDELHHAIAEKAAWTPDAATLSECRTLIRDGDGKPRARGKRKKGKGASRDDRFVSWAGAWQVRSITGWSGAGFHFKGI